MPKAAVRFRPIRSLSGLAAATRHARREDAVGRARVREGATPGAGLSWTAYGADRDHVAAFKAYKAATGAAERKGAPIALQAICVVSPEWVDAAGDRHDDRNPRNRALMVQARAWAESWAGEGSVIAARLDLDEVGGGVVDLMLVPVRTQRSRTGKGTLRISTNGALSDLAASTGEARSYAAAQTSWAAWCQRALDPVIQRGTPREQTGARHMRPEAYGAMRDALRASARRAAEIERKALEVERKALAEAATLRSRGKAWAAWFAQKVRREAAMERAAILAPLATWRGRWSALVGGDRDERDAAVAAAREDERSALGPLRERAERAEGAAREERRRAENVRANYADVSAQRDAAWRQLQELQPGSGRGLGRGGPGRGR